MVDTVMDIRDFVPFEVHEGKGGNGEDLVGIISEDGKCLMGMGNVGVVNALWEFHDHEFTDGVLYINAPRGAILIDGEVGGGDRGDVPRQRYWVKDKGGGYGGTRASRGGRDVVHDVAGGGSKLKLSNFKGHKVARRLEERLLSQHGIYTMSAMIKLVA